MEDDGECAHCLSRECHRIHAGEGAQGFEAGGNVTEPAGVQGACAAIVSGVECGEQLADLFSATLADHQAIRPHAQRLTDQAAQRDAAGALEIRLPRLESDVVRMPRPQFGDVFDRHDALPRRDLGQQSGEQRGLLHLVRMTHLSSGGVEMAMSVLERPRTGEIAGVAEQVLVYLRISEDRTGEEAGVERQRDDCLALCGRLGLDVAAGDVFMDNDTSAYLNKKRPEFEKMLARVRQGPSRVVVWHVDRLYRRPRELEDLIDLVESHPIRIEAVMGGAFDLNTHEGRLMARQLVAMAAYESGHKADRIRRANRQKAERGDWHGAAKFGYGTGGVLIPEQAAVIREMADRFLAGQSLRSITAWLNEESGFPAPQAHTGKTLGVWHATTVKSILVSARISGQRAYEPARKSGDAPAGREILGPGNWEAIITPEETTRIRAMLSHPDRRVGASSINLLSAIATCGKCGSGLVSGKNRRGPSDAKRRYYRCMPVPGHPERGGLSVTATGLETVVSEAVSARLAATTLPADDGKTGGAVAEAMGRIMAARHRMEDLARDYGTGLLARSEYHAGRVAAQNAVRDAETTLGTLNRGDALKGLPIGDEAALRHAWYEEWTVGQKRAILNALIDTLVVLPDPNCGSRFRPERVQLTFKA